MWIGDRINGDRVGPLARYDDFNGKCVLRDESKIKDKNNKDDDESMENYSQCQDDLSLCKRYILTSKGSRLKIKHSKDLILNLEEHSVLNMEMRPSYSY